MPDQHSPAGGPAGEVQAKTAQVAAQAQEKAQQATVQVQERVREQIDQRSSELAEQISEYAADLRSVGESLRSEGKEAPAKAADRLARYAEKVGGYLSEKDSGALLSDAEDFGRRQPLIAAAGGLTLGFAASRFLKASSSRRYENHPSRRPSSPALPPTALNYAGVAPGSGQVTPGAAAEVL